MGIIPRICDDFLPCVQLTLGFGRLGIIKDFKKIAYERIPRVPPSLHWNSMVEDNLMFTLLMIDADFFTSKGHSSSYAYVHWAVGNIEGNRVEDGTVLQRYQAPKPAIGTGTHRYILLLFLQIGYIDFAPLHEDRCVEVKQFAKQYGLVTVGSTGFQSENRLWTGNYFTANVANDPKLGAYMVPRGGFFVIL